MAWYFIFKKQGNFEHVAQDFFLSDHIAFNLTISPQ